MIASIIFQGSQFVLVSLFCWLTIIVERTCLNRNFANNATGWIESGFIYPMNFESKRVFSRSMIVLDLKSTSSIRERTISLRRHPVCATNSKRAIQPGYHVQDRKLDFPRMAFGFGRVGRDDQTIYRPAIFEWNNSILLVLLYLGGACGWLHLIGRIKLDRIGKRLDCCGRIAPATNRRNTCCPFCGSHLEY